MKFFLSLVLTALLAFFAGLYFPWWSIAIASFLFALVIHQSPGKAFLSAFCALFLLWGTLALWIDIKNQGLLSKKVATLFHLSGSSILLILVTALIGALVAGFAAMSASYLTSKRGS